MRSTLRSVFASMFFAAAVVGCGGGGGGGDEGGSNPSGTSTPPTTSDITVDQLTGTWFGTFDDKSSVRTMELKIDAGNITAISLDGTSTNLTSALSKANGAARTFRFELKNQAQQTISQGVLLADASATHLVFIDQYFDFGVAQKGATTIPTYAKADVEKSWSGDTTTIATGFTSFGQKSSTGNCASSTATASECDGSIGDVSRAITSLTSDDARGRWLGSYADTPQTGSPQNGTLRVYLSPDKAFAGGWACTDFSTGFPDTCDFFTWNRQ